MVYFVSATGFIIAWQITIVFFFLEKLFLLNTVSGRILLDLILIRSVHACRFLCGFSHIFAGASQPHEGMLRVVPGH